MKKLSLTTQIIISMALGIALGVFLNYTGLNDHTGVKTYLLDGAFAVIGLWFVNALKMLVVPLVLVSLICGVCGIGDIRLLGRVGGKTFAVYLATTAIAIATALGLASLFGVGKGMGLDTSNASFDAGSAPPLVEVFASIVPSNVVEAMATGDMLALIFFATLAGVAVLMVGKKAAPLVSMLELVNEVILNIVTIVMKFAPIGVFALLATSMAQMGASLIAQLLGYVLVLVGALFFHYFVTLMLLLKLGSGLSIPTFIKKMREMQVFAFSTASSNATIPVTMRTATEKMGINRSIASFTIPFGATINMDGTAIMQGVATVFIANLYGVELGITGFMTVIVMAVLASVGTAGVPGVGLIMLTMVFYQVGLPVEGIGIILGVDRLLDMLRTALNVSGDVVVTTIIAKREGQLDLEVYNDPNAGFTDTTDIDPQDEARLAQEVKS